MVFPEVYLELVNANGVFLGKKEFSMYKLEMKHHFLLSKSILPGLLYFLYLLKEVSS